MLYKRRGNIFQIYRNYSLDILFISINNRIPFFFLDKTLNSILWKTFLHYKSALYEQNNQLTYIKHLRIFS